MDRITSSITIGIRELFRILVPGLLVVAYWKVSFPFLLLLWNGAVSLLFILVLSLFTGLVVYALRIYAWCWPWSRVFHEQLERLRREVRVALGGAPPLVTKDYHAEYKLFLETKIDRSFTERVHYFTSFYHLLVEISWLFALFALIEISSWLLAIITKIEIAVWLPTIFMEIELGPIISGHLHIVVAFLCMWGAILFHKFAKQQFIQTINEQIIMVKANRGEFESLQKSSKLEDVEENLKSMCNEMLKEIVLDPDKREYQIECESHSTKDWRTGRDTNLYVLKVYTAYPRAITGDPGGYKGFYKERLEAVLNHIVSLHQGENQVAKVTLEVIPTKVHQDSLESLVPIDKACKEIVTKDSPLLEVVKRFDIRHVLVRGRHLVGPNPGLVQVVEKICQEGVPKSALDLFAGTGVVSKLLHSQGVLSIICVDNGQHFDISKQLLDDSPSITCVREDAFHFRICQAFDLIVADPYYEDVLNFLNAKIQEIHANTRIFVLVCAGIENEYQRDQCKELIQSYFATEPKEHLVYGQSILICRKPT